MKAEPRRAGTKMGCEDEKERRSVEWLGAERGDGTKARKVLTKLRGEILRKPGLRKDAQAAGHGVFENAHWILKDLAP